jgi:menaquinone reductase, multiheme cytochrome c subunit
MQNNDSRATTLFPKWTNAIRPFATIAALGGLVYVVVLIGYATAPQTTNIGYAPTQPVPYSHALHVGELGLDCRYCHAGVETGAKATIPPTQTCMNCHAGIKAKSEALAPVFASYASGMPLEWVRVHDLPDFVYFDHSAHVRRGVGCVSCHGRVDEMEVVSQVSTLGMGWCLDCHRGPEEALRPRDKVTDMTWQADGDPLALGEQLRRDYHIQPPTDCSTCHR